VPEERELFGKPAEALVRLEARSGAGMLELEIRDDGRGILADRVRSAAQDRGIFSSEQLAKMDEEQLKTLIFHEGFSTSMSVTDVSGRGVGLAIVRTQIERIGGRVEFSSIDGEGAGFRLMLPLNLATARFVLVEASGELFAVPALSVERVVRVRVEDLVRVDHGMAFELDGKPAPISRLSDAVGLPSPAKSSGRLVALVLGASSERAAFVVDRIADEREFVARNLGDHLRPLGLVNGVAVLPDGTLAPILNAADLLRRALAADAASASFEQRHTEGSRAARRVLVVDDSVTTRTLEKSILEAAGYQVSVAVDGMEALERLGRSQFDLVLSDVQMPRMDGLTLVRTMKQDARLRELPVVLVSSLDAADQRRQGLDAGADAYLSKGEFEQGLLLSTLGRFL
jgi:two-component system chemotaxis sensor kinase CheA